MSALVFKLNHVPEDEASDIREILDANQINYYETTAGNWGISMPAIWVKEKTQVEQAKILINTYEQQRSRQEKAKYQQKKRQGEQQKLIHVFKHKPLNVIIYFSIIVLVLYLSFRLVVDFSR